jgi:hypothetical protein
LNVHHFWYDAEVIAAAQTRLDWQISEFLFQWRPKVTTTG